MAKTRTIKRTVRISREQKQEDAGDDDDDDNEE